MAESVHADTLRTRRSLLAAAAGGAAALAATALKPESVQAVSGPMTTETDHATVSPTGVTHNGLESPAFFGRSFGGVAGVQGTSVTGNGVEGTSASGTGVTGISEDTSDPANDVENAGVVGVAGDTANTAANKSLTGVYGYSDPSADIDFIGAGVWGDSPDAGVIGTGGVFGVFAEGAIGVLANTVAPNGFGVYAAADQTSALALRVEGRAEFTRSGRFTMSAGTKKRTITLAGCTSSTIVFAVLASNRKGFYVRAVVPGAGSFAVYVNANLPSASNVSWIAFTNPANHSG